MQCRSCKTTGEKVRAKYRSVSLIDKNDKNYLAHVEKMRFIRNCNRSASEPDYKRVITSWLEVVVNKHLSKFFIQDTRNILTWEELNNMTQYCRRYREIDGLFSLGEEKIYIEVKASLSKSNFNKGKSQINETLTLLTTTSKRPLALLIMADCRCYDPSFGFAKDFIDEKINASDAYKPIEGLTIPNSFKDSSKWLWTLSQADVEQLANVYGPPKDEEFEEDY